MCIFFLTTTILTHENEHKESEYYKIINNAHKIKRSSEILLKENYFFRNNLYQVVPSNDDQQNFNPH